MARWKVDGYLIEQYKYDVHPPVHVHVFRDGRLLARVAIPTGEFLTLADARHRGRIRRALKRKGLIQ